jgi:hypothetical protein
MGGGRRASERASVCVEVGERACVREMQVPPQTVMKWGWERLSPHLCRVDTPFFVGTAVLSPKKARAVLSLPPYPRTSPLPHTGRSVARVWILRPLTMQQTPFATAPGGPSPAPAGGAAGGGAPPPPGSGGLPRGGSFLEGRLPSMTKRTNSLSDLSR